MDTIKNNIKQNISEYVCLTCGAHFDIDTLSNLTTCPTCGNFTFKKEE